MALLFLLGLFASHHARHLALPSVCHVYDLCSYLEPWFPAIVFKPSQVLSEVCSAPPEVLLLKFHLSLGKDLLSFSVTFLRRYLL